MLHEIINNLRRILRPQRIEEAKLPDAPEMVQETTAIAALIKRRDTLKASGRKYSHLNRRIETLRLEQLRKDA